MGDPLLVCPSDDELRRRTSIKWSRIERGDIAADVAELDFDVAPPIRQALYSTVNRSDFGYPSFTSGTTVRLKEVFVDRMSSRFGWCPDPDRVEVCGQVIQALCCAIMVFTDPGDVVVTHSPTYLPIRRAIEHLGRRCVTIPVENLKDTAHLRKTLSAQQVERRVRMFVLCQPHNPTGHIFSEQTLAVLGTYSADEEVVVFSDEIHQDLVHGAAESCSPASTDSLAQRTVSFTSAAKSFNIPGLRCAIGHFGSPELHAAFCRLPWHLRDGASLLGIAATLAAWESSDIWLQALKQQLLRNREILVDALCDVAAVHWALPSATYLAWLDFRDSPAAGNPRKFFIERGGVHLQAGGTFGSDFNGFARLNFGTSEPRLFAILERIADSLSTEVIT
jgi:cysteine-S-conjugate beta-lyase